MTITTRWIRFKFCILFVLCFVWGVGFWVGWYWWTQHRHCLKLSRLLNQNQMPLAAMAEIGQEQQDHLFQRGHNLNAASYSKSTLMSIFLPAVHLMAKRGDQLHLFFPSWIVLWSCKLPDLKLSFLPVLLPELAFCNINMKDAGAQHQWQAWDWWPALTEVTSCQIHQLQYEAAPLECTYICT